MLGLGLLYQDISAQNLFAEQGENLLHTNIGNIQSITEESVGWETSLGFTLGGRFTASLGYATLMDDDFGDAVIDGTAFRLQADFLLLKQGKDLSRFNAGPYVSYQGTSLSGEEHRWLKVGMNLSHEIKVVDDISLIPALNMSYNSIEASSRTFDVLDNFYSFGFTLGIRSKDRYLIPQYIIQGIQGGTFDILVGSFF